MSETPGKKGAIRSAHPFFGYGSLRLTFFVFIGVDLSGVAWDVIHICVVKKCKIKTYQFSFLLGMELSSFCECGEMTDMDGNLYKELLTLNRVIWWGAITRMNLPLI